MRLDLITQFAPNEVIWEEIVEVEDLPENMQIPYEMVNPEASIASFICYCDNAGIDSKVIADRVGFTSEEIKQVILEAKENAVYEKLWKEFMR